MMLSSRGSISPWLFFSPGNGENGESKIFPREFPLGKDFYLVKYHFDQIYKAESRFLSIFGLYVTCNG